MALKPSVSYPGQVSTSDPAGYPYGKAQNQAVLGDNTGTPLEKDWVNDVFGFQQALLAAGRVVPTGTPDKVGASQYMTALSQALQPLQVLSWDQPVFFGINMLPVDPAHAQFVAVSPNVAGLVNDQVAVTADGGNTWAPITLGTPTGVLMLTAAADPAGSKAIVTGSKSGGTDIQHNVTLGGIGSLGTWSPTTPPGTPTSLTCSLFDPGTGRFIVAGKTGSAPYIATCESSDLTTWTQRTVPGSITGSNDALSLVRLGTTIIASWAGQTKVAYSTDGGVTWTASTTSLASGSYVVQAGDASANSTMSVFLALDAASSHLYSSTDGITWTALTAFSRDVLLFNRNGFKFLGGVFILRALTSPFFYYSLDAGNTWVRVQDSNRTWNNFAVVRSRLLNFRSIVDGPNLDCYMERSLPIALPATP